MQAQPAVKTSDYIIKHTEINNLRWLGPLFTTIASINQKKKKNRKRKKKAVVSGCAWPGCQGFCEKNTTRTHTRYIKNCEGGDFFCKTRRA